jgi:hypothetical protein
MTQNLYDAHRQWHTRPPDERFADLDSLQAHTGRVKVSSQERVTELVDLHLDVTDRLGIALNGHEERALLTNWSFNQLCTAIGAPARYLRTLPPHTVVECMRWGLGDRDAGAKLLYRSGGADKTVAAFTGPNYGRIWDDEVVATLRDAIAGTGWKLPPGYGNVPTGLYASDRDMFAFLVNDEAPVEVGNAKLSRGFFVWNSETGATTFGLTTFLYNHVCGNGVVWGAEDVYELKIVHRAKALDRFRSDAIPALNQFVESRTVGNTIRQVVEDAMQRKVGESLEDVVASFSSKPFSKKEITDAWNQGLAEGENPTTLWGMVQGLTARARTYSHIDARVDLERRAGLLLRQAA